MNYHAIVGHCPRQPSCRMWVGVPLVGHFSGVDDLEKVTQPIESFVSLSLESVSREISTHSFKLSYSSGHWSKQIRVDKHKYRNCTFKC